MHGDIASMVCSGSQSLVAAGEVRWQRKKQRVLQRQFCGFFLLFWQFTEQQ